MGLESKNVLEKSLCVTSQEKKLFGFDQGEKKVFLLQGEKIIWLERITIPYL